MGNMSRDRRKPSPRDLGSMRAATPPEDEPTPPPKPTPRMSMEPAPGVAERALEEVRREKEREQMGEAYDKASTPKYAKGGSVGSASKRADGCAQRGKTKGRFV